MENLNVVIFMAIKIMFLRSMYLDEKYIWCHKKKKTQVEMQKNT